MPDRCEKINTSAKHEAPRSSNLQLVASVARIWRLVRLVLNILGLFNFFIYNKKDFMLQYIAIAKERLSSSVVEQGTHKPLVACSNHA